MMGKYATYGNPCTLFVAAAFPA
ncbi:MAG: hypothetical protein QOF95_1374, partial [Pseudonocardiales bacterium]|nr:hypothetical protein [Pseudonocardiales bacterium]